MKKFNSGSLLFLILVLSACNNNSKSPADKKESSTEKPVESNNASAENIISFKVDKELIVSSVWNISRFDFGTGVGPSLNITSNMFGQPKTINININGNKAGTYHLESGIKTTTSRGTAYGTYAPDNNLPEHFTFKDGEFVIVSMDTTAGLLNATFHGTAKNEKGETLTITDGNIINGKMKPGITKL